jgi:NADH-quinone oxidoreductase subunit C
MNITELAEYIGSLLPGCKVTEGKQFAEVALPPEMLHDAAFKLRNDAKASFDFLVCITGVDYGQDLGATYHLRSVSNGYTVVLKVRTSDRENPHFDSVTDIWKSADLMEREIYDLLGIKFTGHPDLRRLFLDRSWGFPLRKDYMDDTKIVTK